MEAVISSYQKRNEIFIFKACSVVALMHLQCMLWNKSLRF